MRIRTWCLKLKRLRVDLEISDLAGDGDILDGLLDGHVAGLLGLVLVLVHHHHHVGQELAEHLVSPKNERLNIKHWL